MDSYKIYIAGIRDIQKDIDNIVDSYTKKSSVSTQLLYSLKSSINKFFKDAKCDNIIFTDNDKMFFGMCVVPNLTTAEVLDIISDDKPFIIKRYSIEMDSKLFDPRLGMSSEEITAIILHEIGHLVNTSAPVEKIRQALDVTMMETNETINIKNIKKSRELIVFGVKDSIRKVTSMFESKNKEEILADEFVIYCGYGEYLVSALKKIERAGFFINDNVPNKLVVLAWVMRLYGNLNERRVSAMYTLNKVKKTTGSVFIKRDIDNLSDSLKDSAILTEADSGDSRKKYKFKYDILRKYEDNYYEYALRLKSANVEDDALRLLREINTRISVIEEFLEEVELQESDRKRFTNLFHKYIDLREALSKKDIVKNKYVGLWVEYPEFE